MLDHYCCGRTALHHCFCACVAPHHTSTWQVKHPCCAKRVVRARRRCWRGWACRACGTQSWAASRGAPAPSPAATPAAASPSTSRTPARSPPTASPRPPDLAEGHVSNAVALHFLHPGCPLPQASSRAPAWAQGWLVTPLAQRCPQPTPPQHSRQPAPACILLCIDWSRSPQCV